MYSVHPAVNLPETGAGAKGPREALLVHLLDGSQCRLLSARVRGRFNLNASDRLAEGDGKARRIEAHTLSE
jgi:hypothetical protein